MKKLLLISLLITMSTLALSNPSVKENPDKNIVPLFQTINKAPQDYNPDTNLKDKDKVIPLFNAMFKTEEELGQYENTTNKY